MCKTHGSWRCFAFLRVNKEDTALPGREGSHSGFRQGEAAVLGFREGPGDYPNICGHQPGGFTRFSSSIAARRSALFAACSRRIDVMVGAHQRPCSHRMTHQWKSGRFPLTGRPWYDGNGRSVARSHTGRCPPLPGGSSAHRGIAGSQPYESTETV